MKYLISLFIAGVVALGACSPKTKVHYVPMAQTAIFQVHYDNKTTVVDSTLYCEHEVTMFVFDGTSVFLVDGDTTSYKIVSQVSQGVFVLDDGTPLPTVLHVHKYPLKEGDEEKFSIYFQKGRYIMRFSQHKDLSCEEL